MVSHAIKILCFLTVLSCTRDDAQNTTAPGALMAARMLCNNSTEEMQWFKNVLQQMDADPALRGDIYAVPVDGVMIFVHQPLIMSCLACVLYDCEGNQIPFSTYDPEKVRLGLTPSNRIYSAVYE